MSSVEGELNRRRLPKSKTGCRRCKKRKVKCDEAQPSCNNCKKHGVTCDFTATAAGNEDGTVVQGPYSPSTSSTPHNGLLPPETNGSFSIDDMELLHHYTTSTHLTFAQADPSKRNFWRVNVPQMGFSTRYILHGILSIAALHLARYRPERREFFLTQAFLHHNASSSLAAPLISELKSENSPQLFIFSAITLIFAFAKPSDPGVDDFLPEEGQAVPQWLYLIRGSRALFNAEQPTLQKPLMTILGHSRDVRELFEKEVFENEAIQDLEASISLHVPKDLPKFQVLRNAIDWLKKTLALVYSSGIDNDNKDAAVYVWLFKIEDEFVELVRHRDNEALCVLGFFCVVLRRLEYRWHFEGWGLRLIERIYSLLSDMHRLWIRWPIEEIGWIPPNWTHRRS